jgi:hypothetical protein
MCDNDETGTYIAVKFQHQLEHPAGGVSIKISSWLVGKHAGGLCDQRTSHRSTLALSTGKFPWGMSETMSKANLFQHG